MDFYQWLQSVGLIGPNEDPTFYSGGSANLADFQNLLTVTWGRIDDEGIRSQWLSKLVDMGAIGDPTVFDGASPELITQALTAAANSLAGTDSGASEGPKALPTNSQLIKVGNEYRVIWALGEGLGYAWYQISEDQVKNVFGDKFEDNIANTVENPDVFRALYGDFYWGNIAEVNITSDDPWDDLKTRVFESYGYVSGIDTPEVKRLVLQAYFEQWDGDEFVSHYRNTEYFNSLGDLQRTWSTLSEAERDYRVRSRAATLADFYRNQYGDNIEGGLNSEQLLDWARQVESGVLPVDEWEFNTRTSASAIEGTPAWITKNETDRAAGEAAVTIENLIGFVEDQWKDWLGTNPMPADFASKWGNWLYMNKRSEEELEDRLQQLGSTRWENKPPEIPWSEWASVFKGQIGSTLELTSVADEDPLLQSLLSQGLQGQDMNQAIRSDQRFKETTSFRDQMNSTVSRVGRTMGFIAQ